MWNENRPEMWAGVMSWKPKGGGPSVEASYLEAVQEF